MDLLLDIIQDYLGLNVNVMISAWFKTGVARFFALYPRLLCGNIGAAKSFIYLW